MVIEAVASDGCGQVDEILMDLFRALKVSLQYSPAVMYRSRL